MNTTTLIADESAIQYRWLVVSTIMLLAILEVLDSTIVNVALPAMMPSLGANQNEITWVLTSYVVAAAVVLPLTGFLSNQFGQKRFLIICASGFMLSSFLCGLSTSLSEIVIFRIFQGAFGSSLIPISQAILRKTFPKEQQGKAMAIWGLGIMAAPVFGPTLGGFITEHSSWRWVFYINLPVCLLGLMATFAFIPDSEKIKQKIDFLGLILMIIGIAALQIFLDKGNEYGWLSSPEILSLVLLSGFTLTYFILHTIFNKNPLINLRLYKVSNFAAACLLMSTFCGCMFSLVTLEPILLQNIYGYTAMIAGSTMAGSGIASGIAMVISGNFMHRINVNVLLILGLVFCATGSYLFSCISPSSTQAQFFLMNACVGFGMGIFMVPLSTFALLHIKNDDMNEAAGLFSYARMLGTSIGISIFITLASNLTQVSWNSLIGHVTNFNTALTHWLHLQGANHLNGATISRLNETISSQATLIGFIDTFHVIALVFLAMIPLTFCLKK